MGFSKVTNRWLNRTYKIIAILLVVFAALISSLRLFLPYAHNYRVDLQDYLNQQFDSNVVIGQLNMGWQGSGPSLVAGDVVVLDSDAASISIKSMDFHIDFWRSLQLRKIVTKDLTLDGVDVHIDQTLLQQSATSEQDLSLLDSIAALFLEQISRFTLKNSEITYRQLTQDRAFFIDEMQWKNAGKAHYAQGSVVVDGLSSNNLQLSMRLIGETIGDMAGTVYLQANELNITPWLDRVLAIEDEQTHSSINFDAWLTLEHGVLKKAQFALGENQIDWQTDTTQQVLSLNKGHVIVEHINQSKRTQIYSSPIDIKLNEMPWQSMSLQAFNASGESLIYLDQLALDRFASILPLFYNSPTLQQTLDAMVVEGKLKNLFVRKQADNLSVVADIEDIAFDEHNNIPGVSEVSGNLVYDRQQLALSVNAEHGLLDLGEQFLAPLPFESLRSQFHVDLQDEQVKVVVDDLAFNSSDITLSVDAKVFVPESGGAQMSLLALAKDIDSINAKKFFPNKLMGQNLVDYLNRSLKRGRIEQANVLFNGKLADFPFGQGDGTFIVDAELINSEFEFDSSWPEITSFAANLNFTNNGMVITGRQGRLSGLAVEGVIASIPQLSHEQVLHVDANLPATPPEYIANLMNASPLADSVGEALTSIKVTGDITGNFQLALPLDDVEQALATGEIHFNQNNVQLTSPDMQFSGVSGELTFVNDKLATRDLALIWRGLPLALKVSAEQRTRYYQTIINMQAQWAESLWHQQLPVVMRQYAEGELAWQGDLSLNFYQGKEFSYSFDLLSNLAGTRLNLPEPFAKAQPATIPVSVSVSGQEDKSTITAVMGEQLNFYGVLDHELISFTQSHLVLGNEQMLMPTSGFYITTQLAQVEFAPWYSFVGDLLASVTSERQSDVVPLFPSPERISGAVGKLNVLGQEFSDVSYSVVDEQAWQLLQINAKEARTSIKFFPDWLAQGIAVDADFIHLPIKAESNPQPDDVVSTIPDVIAPRKEKPAITDEQLFSQFPPMQVKCRSCKVGLLDLGEVDFSVERTDSENIRLNNFVAKRGKSKISVDGHWLYNQQMSKTTLKGNFNADNIGREIEKLGYASIIKDSGIDLTFDLNWQGGPHRYQLATLDGNIASTLGAGYLADVSDKGLRIFSILSLQSLVRKLTLDFRDIFSDGLFYSDIKGDMEIKQGVLFTDNTRLKGTAGDLSVKGNTDLNKGILDYHMSYKPNLTSSLPVLAWIATLNPVTFLAGVAIDEVFTSKVVSEYNMKLTGNVADPDLKVIDRKSKNVSVSRSSPPKIVENEIEAPIQEGQVNPMKKDDPIKMKPTPKRKQKSMPDGENG